MVEHDHAKSLDRLTQLLLQALDEKGSGYERAEMFVRFEEPLDQYSTRTGGQLKGLAPDKGPVPMGDHKVWSDAIEAFLISHRDAGIPIRSLDYRFHRTGEGWQVDLRTETLHDHEQLRRELAPLEEVLVGTALRLAGDRWTRVSVTRSHVHKVDLPGRLIVFSGRDRASHEMPAELVDRAEAIERRFADSGRELQVIRLGIEGAPGRHRADWDYYYRLHPGVA